jgi:hypothetical protein
MLCPTCKHAAPGGTICPTCNGPIPEQETFEGQGGHYLRVFLLLSLILFVLATTVASLRSAQPFRPGLLLGSRWFWLYLLIFFLPVGLGVHFWYMLRGERVRVSDTFIERLSHWGDEKVLWADVIEYRKQILPFRDTRLGHVARLSRWLTHGRFVSAIPPYAYDLIAVNAAGERQLFRLEPGSVNDVAWLLALIAERVGEPRSA